MCQKPKIGYTTRNFSIDPLQWAIDISIRICGGKPVRLTPGNSKKPNKIDGLIIGGGTDLYPALYNLDPKPNYKYDRDRDDMEIEWLKIAEKQKIPVLGICRGAQLLNVTRGGTLHVDVSKIYENAKYPSSLFANVFFRKKINITVGSLLHNLLDTTQTSINSMHKQAIDTVGKNLIISAKENNGIVQAIEDPHHPYFLGIQFHPETLIYRKEIRNIFKRLIEKSKH